MAYDGCKEAGDRFIPEAFQKIGQQAPNIVKDPVRAVIGGADALSLDDRADGLGERLQELGGVVKEGVDALTFQTPRYDPRITDPDVVSLTESDPVEAGRVADPDEVLSLDPEELPDEQIEKQADPDMDITLPETT